MKVRRFTPAEVKQRCRGVEVLSRCWWSAEVIVQEVIVSRGDCRR